MLTFTALNRLCVLIALFSGASLLSLATALPAQESSDNEELLRSYAEAWNSGDLEPLNSILADDFIRHGNYGSTESRQGLVERIGEFREFYRDLRIDVYDVIASDTKGAMRWRFTGGYGNTSFDIDTLNFSMYHFENGRISQEWVVGNTVDFWTSMGYTIMPPGTTMVPPDVESSPDDDPLPPPIDAEDLVKPGESNLQKPRRRGHLELSANLDCQLRLDGKNIGWLAAGQPVSLAVDPGTHLVEASSRGGSLFFRQSVEVRKGKALEIRLQAPGRAIVNPRSRTTEDLETGLMWQVTDNGSDISQTSAEAHCRNLEQGGYSDWRLPSLFELEKLYAPELAGSKRFHSIPGINLTGCCPWTTTPHGEFHWTFVFYNGLRYMKYRSIAKFSRALCVRNGWDDPVD